MMRDGTGKETKRNLFIDKLLKPKRNGTTFCLRDVDVYYLMIVCVCVRLLAKLRAQGRT